MDTIIIIAPNLVEMVAIPPRYLGAVYSVTSIQPQLIVDDLLNLKKAHGHKRALVIEATASTIEEDYFWVSDAINRSGDNPLRGLRGNWDVPFLDLSDLYYAPTNQKSVTVMALGSRAAMPGETITCAQLHALSLLAYRANYAVSGIVVSENAGASIDLEMALEMLNPNTRLNPS